MSTPILQILGAQFCQKAHLEGSGGKLDLEIKDSTIYYVKGYEKISIILPSSGDYTAHLYVTFPTTENPVGFELPEGLSVYGTAPTRAAAGESWEVSIDNAGGALFAQKRATV